MTTTNHPISVVLADDHELFRDGFSVMIKKCLDIELIGEASNGQELLEIVLKLIPDVVITDIKMPVLDGIEVTKKLKADHPDMKVIALSNYDEEHLIMEMLEVGAKGYLLKSSGKEEITKAIKTVHAGRTHFSKEISKKIQALIAESDYNPFRKKHRVEFSEKELSIITLICQGLTNKEIAAQLFLSPRTIETHRDNIMDKIEENNMAALIVYAIKNGIFKF